MPPPQHRATRGARLVGGTAAGKAGLSVASWALRGARRLRAPPRRELRGGGRSLARSPRPGRPMTRPWTPSPLLALSGRGLAGVCEPSPGLLALPLAFLPWAPADPVLTSLSPLGWRLLRRAGPHPQGGVGAVRKERSPLLSSRQKAGSTGRLALPRGGRLPPPTTPISHSPAGLGPASRV